MKLIPTPSRGLIVNAAVMVAATCLFAACERSKPVATEGESSKSVLTLTKANFQAEVLSSTQPVLVDFWATWCGPCKMIAPIVAELANEFEGKAKVGKVDVDAEPSLAKQFGISALPTLLIFKDGRQVSQFVGLQSKAQLKAALTKFTEEGAAKPVPPKP